MSIEQLKQDVEAAKVALAAAEQALASFEASPDQNVFPSLDEAESVLEDRMRGWAFDDCQGAYNVGADVYEQEFIVDGLHYIAELKCEYNRHDKMYYYLDGAKFSYKAK